jgi:hypothetical protein
MRAVSDGAVTAPVIFRGAVTTPHPALPLKGGGFCCVAEGGFASHFLPIIWAGFAASMDL